MNRFTWYMFKSKVDNCFPASSGGPERQGEGNSARALGFEYFAWKFTM